MIIYKTVISYSGTLEDEIEDVYWDEKVAIREAKKLIEDDEKSHEEPDDYEIYWVEVLTEVSNSNGTFTTIKSEIIRHNK